LPKRNRPADGDFPQTWGTMRQLRKKKGRLRRAAPVSRVMHRCVCSGEHDRESDSVRTQRSEDTDGLLHDSHGLVPFIDGLGP
jgi:hypothetical protein